jgi:hypothetical protein
MYGFRKGDEYLSVMRYYDIAKFWSWQKNIVVS